MNNSNDQILHMKESDLPEIIDMFIETFNSLGEKWTKENAYGYLGRGFTEGSSWVYKIDNKIVGLLITYIFPREDYKELFVDYIAVHPSYQGKGIGKALWNKANEFAKENKIEVIGLLSSKKLPSFEWYKKLGMKESDWVEMLMPVI